MKPLLYICFIMLFSVSAKAQEIAFFPEGPQASHLASVHTGINFTTGYGLSYGYKIPVKFPVVIGTELTTPFGGKIMDDFKAGLSVQTIFRPVNHLGISLKPSMSCSKYGSEAAMLLSINAGLSTTVGYYRNTWSIAGEAGYENVRATLVKNRLLHEYYPEIKDEWYASTGGYFNFGLLASYWIKSTGIMVKAGKTFGQNFSDHPTVPYYADFSVMQKF
jgi:hypothetical protein